MWAADQMGRHKRGEDDTTLKDAMSVGSSQILALLFPGFSRSGATMSTALTATSTGWPPPGSPSSSASRP